MVHSYIDNTFLYIKKDIYKENRMKYICKECDTIITPKNMHTCCQCWDCRKKYLRNYYDENFKSYGPRRSIRDGRLIIHAEKEY